MYNLKGTARCDRCKPPRQRCHGTKESGLRSVYQRVAHHMRSTKKLRLQASTCDQVVSRARTTVALMPRWPRTSGVHLGKLWY